MKVKPAPGLKVRDPQTMLHIPDEGADVPESSYWVRLLACGDVLRVDCDQIPDSEETAK